MAGGYQDFKCINCGTIFDLRLSVGFNKLGNPGQDFCCNKCFHQWKQQNPPFSLFSKQKKDEPNNDNKSPKKDESNSTNGFFEKDRFPLLTTIGLLFLTSILYIFINPEATWAKLIFLFFFIGYPAEYFRHKFKKK